MNLDPDKLIVLFVIAMIVLGPKRLPEAARTAGRWLAEVRKYSAGLRNEMRDLLDDPAHDGAGMRDELRKAFAEPREAIEAGAREMRSGWHPEAPSASPTLAPPPVMSGAVEGTEAALPVPDDPTLN